jgi:hypothetical protein
LEVGQREGEGVAAAAAMAAVEEAREEREGEAEKAMSGRKGLSFSFPLLVSTDGSLLWLSVCQS